VIDFIRLCQIGGLKAARTPNSFAIFVRSCSMAEGSPKPFNITLHPAPANARAMPRPIPLVEPVMIAVLPFGIVFGHTWQR